MKGSDGILRDVIAQGFKQGTTMADMKKTFQRGLPEGLPNEDHYIKEFEKSARAVQETQKQKAKHEKGSERSSSSHARAP